jgi:hypothetical protein
MNSWSPAGDANTAPPEHESRDHICSMVQFIINLPVEAAASRSVVAACGGDGGFYGS